jgi:hypothetical protein
MKSSPTMQQVVQQLMKQHGVDLLAVDTFLRLDLAGHDSLVIDHVGASQIAVAHCFAQAGEWLMEREVLFFIHAQEGWIPIEITQLPTGWIAYAKLDTKGSCLFRINHCGQEKLAEFTERWARKLLSQGWLEQSVPYTPWTPPSRKEWS